MGPKRFGPRRHVHLHDTGEIGKCEGTINLWRPAVNRLRVMRMPQRTTSLVLACAFLLLLAATAWDHCWPDPDGVVLDKSIAAKNGYLRKPHHVCAALKDRCDFFAFVSVAVPQNSGAFQDALAHVPYQQALRKFLSLDDLSPPSGQDSKFFIPIFQLHSNLRL